MPATIKIRNVPDDVHRCLKARAASRSMPLSSFILHELHQIAGRPTLAEMLARLREYPEVTPAVSSADIIRERRGPI